jgi:hypothetical protein
MTTNRNFIMVDSTSATVFLLAGHSPYKVLRPCPTVSILHETDSVTSTDLDS